MNTPAPMIELKDMLILHKPNLDSFERQGVHFFMDGDLPNWISTDARGAQILSWIDGKKNLGEMKRLYAEFFETDGGRAWLHVHTFAKEALAKGIAASEAFRRPAYKGRQYHLRADKLKEFWVHVTQACNLSCAHCLVSSSPKGEKGPDASFYFNVMDQAHELGVRRFFFTGGEPFVRADIFELIRRVTETYQAELIILTNAMLLEGTRLAELKTLNRERLKFQVSLDGTAARTNDAIRGKGVFEKTSQGIRTLNGLGFEVSLTAAVTGSNIQELRNMPELAKTLGAKSIHLMWLHKRGKVLETREDNFFPSNTQLLSLARQVKIKADELDIPVDNYESLKIRANGQPGVKLDLGNQCWESLCLYIDGYLYPSASMAGVPALRLGDAARQTVRTIWLDSPAAQTFREASVASNKSLQGDPFRFIAGGGDIEHAYFFSINRHSRESGNPGLDPRRDDPYYDLQVEMIKDIMERLALRKKAQFNTKSGFNAPVIYHAMGDGSVTCSEDAAGLLAEGLPAVKTLRSNCVLAFDVEKPYQAIQKFYGKAAEKPQAELCCPIKYDDSEINHIPQEVIDRFYGCGSPIALANVRAGETTLDLGSGAGIDVFIAAKKVGPAGKAIGVDMTEQMLQVAHENKAIVARNLGFDAVEFRKGYLEKIPAEDKSVDLVTSNCVINLSPDKPKVFAEIWRILKDHGRLAISDIVSDRPVPLSLQAHQDLWGECISGALSEEEFLSGLEKAGFYGISILKKTFWKEVEGHKFYAVTVRGFKFEKRDGCSFTGQKAVYLGPYKATMDEEGHLFPRGEAIEICTDTASKLKAAPYSGQFTVLNPKETLSPSRHPGESRGPDLQFVIPNLDSGFRRNDGTEACCEPGGTCC